jgi:hypothetical protein
MQGQFCSSDSQREIVAINNCRGRILFLDSAACKLTKEKYFIIEKKVQS